jgi:cold shock CspA family protein
VAGGARALGALPARVSPLPSARHRRSGGPAGERVEARVLWFDQIQGVGLAAIAGRERVHVHYRELREGAYRALDAGDTLTLWVERTPDGPVARDVVVVASLPRE